MPRRESPRSKPLGPHSPTNCCWFRNPRSCSSNRRQAAKKSAPRRRTRLAICFLSSLASSSTVSGARFSSGSTGGGPSVHRSLRSTLPSAFTATGGKDPSGSSGATSGGFCPWASSSGGSPPHTRFTSSSDTLTLAARRTASTSGSFCRGLYVPRGVNCSSASMLATCSGVKRTKPSRSSVAVAAPSAADAWPEPSEAGSKTLTSSAKSRPWEPSSSIPAKISSDSALVSGQWYSFTPLRKSSREISPSWSLSKKSSSLSMRPPYFSYSARWSLPRTRRSSPRMERSFTEDL
mmetsp:Transcript_14129/g.53578  ORF Transcript_14129/g.53578 Transcript_14129/m.53578 type:complete len:292 (+) Transcript_14129:1361-2236(+)